MDEIWKPILEFPEHYAVSDLGNVKRTQRSKFGRKLGANLTPKKHVGGYQMVCLSVDSKCVYRTIHSLVLGAFIGQRPEFHEINHKDGNKKNNRLDNLEYCTHSHNQRHAIAAGILSYDSRRKYPKTKPCPVCGKIFVTDPDRRATQVTCSKTCAYRRNTKLTQPVIEKIRAMRAQGIRVVHLAQVLGLGERTVRDALTGRIPHHSILASLPASRAAGTGGHLK